MRSASQDSRDKCSGGSKFALVPQATTAVESSRAGQSERYTFRISAQCNADRAPIGFNFGNESANGQQRELIRV
jgi:hypothetical protein